MSDLLKMPCCTENAIDGQGFHVHHFVDVGGDGSVPVLLRSRIDPYHVRKMMVEFFACAGVWSREVRTGCVRHSLSCESVRSLPTEGGQRQ